MKSRWMFTLLTASLVAGMVGTSYAEVKVSGGELRLRGVMVDNGETTPAALKTADSLSRGHVSMLMQQQMMQRYSFRYRTAGCGELKPAQLQQAPEDQALELRQ